MSAQEVLVLCDHTITYQCSSENFGYYDGGLLLAVLIQVLVLISLSLIVIGLAALTSRDRFFALHLHFPGSVY